MRKTRDEQLLCELPQKAYQQRVPFWPATNAGPGREPGSPGAGRPAAVATGCFGRLHSVDAAENHPAGARLQHARDGQLERFAEMISPLLGNHHRAVVQVSDSLALFFPAF